MSNSDTDSFAALAVLAQCLQPVTVPRPETFIELNREKILRRMLDGLALLLTCDPKDNTACTIHFSAESADNLNIVIIRKLPLDAEAREKLKKVCTDIIDAVIKRPPTRAFLPRNIGVGSHPDESVLAGTALPYCLPRLLHKVDGLGLDTSALSSPCHEAKTNTIQNIITKISGRDEPPTFKHHLVGQRFANASKVYSLDSATEVKSNLCDSLHSLLNIAKGVQIAKDQDTLTLYHLVLLAKQIHSDSVYAALCTDYLNPSEKEILYDYLEALGAYAVALRNLVGMCRTYWRIGKKRPSKINLTILNSTTPYTWNPPSLSSLLSTLLVDIDFKMLPSGIEADYDRECRLPLHEHVEMTMLRYLLQTDFRPVVYYTGMTEKPCLLCGMVFRKLKSKSSSRFVSSHFWNVRGESGVLLGHWLLPETGVSEGDEMRACLAEIKGELIETIYTFVQSSRQI